MSVLLFGPPLTVNEAYRLHNRDRARRVKYWRQLAALTGREHLRSWRESHGEEPVPCRVVAGPITPKFCRQDTGAAMPTVKAIIDGLVDAGYWPDDTSAWITRLELLPQRRELRYPEPGMEITLHAEDELE